MDSVGSFVVIMVLDKDLSLSEYAVVMKLVFDCLKKGLLVLMNGYFQ